MKFIKVVLYLIFLSLILNSCTVKEVEVGNIKSFNIIEVNKEYITVDLAAKVKNPNNFSFTISKVNLDIKFNGVNLGTINKIKSVKIPKNSNDVQHLIFNLKLKNIAKGSLLFIPSLLTSKAKIKVTGYIKAKKFIFGKKINVDYNKTTKISQKLL